MSFQNTIKILSCPQEGHELKKESDHLLCPSCSRRYPLRSERVFFIEPPADAPDSFTANFSEKNRWTEWRRANFSYFKECLSREDTNKIFVDLGAGPSRFRELTTRFETSIGVDFYPHELVQVVADITGRLPFKDGSVDIILLSNVLEHLPTPQSLVTECFRVLKPGGYIIGAVPFLIKVHQAPYDFLRYTNFMLERLFKEAGFGSWEVAALGSPFNVFETMSRQFFSNLRAAPLKPTNRLLARVGEKLHKITIQVFKTVYGSAPASFKYTEGYGFKAQK